MKLKSYIMDEKAVNRALKRIAFEIVERNKGFEDVCLVGIRTRGVPLAKRIADFAKSIEGANIPIGVVDISAFRDDRRRSDFVKDAVKQNGIPFDINGKKVVLVDDVLCTGRTVRAAMDAMLFLSRPKSIQLAVLVDRGHRELPIRPDFVGKNIPTSSGEVVKVSVTELDGDTGVRIYE